MRNVNAYWNLRYRFISGIAITHRSRCFQARYGSSGPVILEEQIVTTLLNFVFLVSTSLARLRRFGLSLAASPSRHRADSRPDGSTRSSCGSPEDASRV